MLFQFIKMKTIQRNFIPGSKWIYFKFYSGTKTTDSILTDSLFLTIKSLKKKGLIEKWFFIRYADPETHLRVRFLAASDTVVSEIINVIYLLGNKLVKENKVWKIQIDTYNRELERYNNVLMEATETLFYIDSECTLALMKRLRRYDEKYQWMIALRMIDTFLSNFSFDLQQKYVLMFNMSNSFKMEFGFTQYNQKQLNAKYREHKYVIEGILQSKIDDIAYLDLCRLLDNVKYEKRTIAKELIRKANANNIELASLLPSYIHMILNRLFCTKNRIYELVLYDFMYRSYSDEIGRNKYLHSI